MRLCPDVLVPSVTWLPGESDSQRSIISEEQSPSLLSLEFLSTLHAVTYLPNPRLISPSRKHTSGSVETNNMYDYTRAPQALYSTADNFSSIPTPQQIELLTIPVSNLKKLGLKKPIDIVAHWTICIDGWCYELGRQKSNKKEPYAYRTLRKEEWLELRGDRAKFTEAHVLGDMAMPYPHHLIHEVGTCSQPNASSPCTLFKFPQANKCEIQLDWYGSCR